MICLRKNFNVSIILRFKIQLERKHRGSGPQEKWENVSLYTEINCSTLIKELCISKIPWTREKIWKKCWNKVWWFHTKHISVHFCRFHKFFSILISQISILIKKWLLKYPNVATFMGCVGKDRYAKIMIDQAKSVGLNVVYQYNDTHKTAKCAVLITGKSRCVWKNFK